MTPGVRRPQRVQLDGKAPLLMAGNPRASVFWPVTAGLLIAWRACNAAEVGRFERLFQDFEYRAQCFLGHLGALPVPVIVISSYSGILGASQQLRVRHPYMIGLPPHHPSARPAIRAGAGPDWPHAKAKGNLQSYVNSKFITKTTPEYVDFQEPARPSFHFLINFPEYVRRSRLGWIGRRVPRSDAVWIGQILNRLSPAQIRDAFRAAGYSSNEVDGFSAVVTRRIAALQALLPN